VLSGKKKSISVHGGGQVIGSLAALLGVEKRKLG
jgi:acetylglutamate kinase